MEMEQRVVRARLSYLVPPELAELIRETARAEGISQVELIRRAVEQHTQQPAKAGK